MKWADRRWWLGAVSLVLVLLVFVADLERASPGPLAPSHAAATALLEPEGCKRCHGRIGESMASACGSCHAEIQDQIAARAGFHGALPPERARACGTCHADHHGADLPLAGALAFAAAGVPERDAFGHEHVAFELHGQHAELGCDECHERADAPFLEEGQTRFLGLVQDCASCHADPHEGRFARGCETCHGQEHPFAAVASFVHGEAFPLVGAHGRPGCLDCHAEGSDHAVEALAGFEPPPAARACADCHPSPHDEGFLGGVAALAGTEVGRSCTLCHDAVHDTFEGDGAEMDADLHAASGFALEAPHADLACADCHAAGPDFAARFPGRDAETCQACHGDPHAADFAGGPFAGEACLTCHERERFEPHAFEAALHARTAFALLGQHAEAACDACHERIDPSTGARAFHGTPQACGACHADAHEGKLAALDGDDGCATCHVPSAFADVDRGAFRHAARTGFVLDGAHAEAGCEACHRPGAELDALGRTFGRVAERFPGRSERCATCHADVHRGTFDGGGVPAEVGGRVGCARCHATEGFRDLRSGSFDHGLWTGFALEGAHDAIACATCHGDAPAGAERSLGFAADVREDGARSCESCHEDVHGGRFDGPGLPARIEDRSGCARCHDVDSFRLAPGSRFDHALWAGWALEGPHARADCAACHVVPREGTYVAALGDVRGSACADCHADVHGGQFLEEGRVDCARCHTVGEGFAALAFDHDAGTRFPLDESHAALDCGACHLPWALPDGSEVVRYRPLGTRCVDCHGLDGRGGGRR